mgnify:CR=1 FL=1
MQHVVAPRRAHDIFARSESVIVGYTLLKSVSPRRCCSRYYPKKGVLPMARNDGKNYSVARNAQYTRSHVGNMERHNERKNEVYQNKDIDLSRSELNLKLQVQIEHL